MKNSITLLLITLSLSANAQFFKRLKEKVSEKINNVVDQKIDNEINKVFDKKKTSENPINIENKAYGNCIIEHNNSFGTIHINKLDVFKVTISNQRIEIIGYWQTHEIDVADNFYLIIKDENATENNIEYYTSKEYKLYKNEDDITSNGAYLKIAYNPEINNNPKAPYQNYTLSTGSINIESINQNTLKFNAKGVPFDTYNSSKDLASKINFNVSINNINISYKEEINKPKETSTTNNENNSSIDLEKYGVTKTPKINKAYTFNTQIDFEMNDGHQNTYMSIWESNDSYFAMEMETDEGKLILITDENNHISLLENNGQKIQIPSTNNNIQNNYKQDLLNKYQDESSFTKTGKTKSILGYKCFEYNVNADEFKASFWISEELKLTNSPFTNSYGTVLESIYHHNNKSYNSKATKIQHKIININTKEYKNFMNMF